MIPNMIQTQNDGYPEKKEPDIEEHEKNVVRVKNSLELKVFRQIIFFYFGVMSNIYHHIYL